MSIIIYYNEQPFYYKDLGEIIFFSFRQPFCSIIGRSLFYRFTPYSALYDADVKCARLPDSQFHGVIYP
jgi:hypothetical protein